MQTSLEITRLCDSPTAHYVLVSYFRNLFSLPIHVMMGLQGDFQGCDRIGYFRVLMVIPRLLINQLHLLICVSKTQEVCVSAAMALVSRFKLIGDKYLYADPKCREIVSRVGWLEFLQKFSSFNMVVSKEFADSFNGVHAQVGDVEIKLSEKFISQAICLP